MKALASGNAVLPGDNHLSPGKTCFGITVSRKVSKKAVVRNRLKRQVRAALRALLPGIQEGRLVVVSLRPTAVACEYKDFLRELEQLLRKLEVIDGHS
jgi:ribonuclease P protein component